jgi:hypothetical protein
MQCKLPKSYKNDAKIYFAFYVFSRINLYEGIYKTSHTPLPPLALVFIQQEFKQVVVVLA